MSRSPDYQRRQTHDQRKFAAKVAAKRTADKGNSVGEKRHGYNTNSHHLLAIHEPPQALLELRNRLQLPQHKDIADFANAQSGDFSEALGAIAAALDIVLDGFYDPIDICALLVKALDNRSEFKHRAHELDPRLKNVELIEHEKDVEIVEVLEGSIAAIPKTPSMIFMEEQDCDVCEAIATCMRAGRCLSGSALDAGIEEQERMN